MIESLLPGDILMWRIAQGASLVPRLIGWAESKLGQGSKSRQYYHVGFVGPDNGHFYQSRPPKICNTPIPRPLPDYVEVYRLKQPPNAVELSRIFSYAESQVGKWYNFIGVLTWGYLQVGDLPYCSQFTWQAYTHGNILLCPWDKLESPDDIASSELLERIA